MGLLDRAKRWLGMDAEEEEEAAGPDQGDARDGGRTAAAGAARGAADPRLAARLAEKRRGDRPPLADPPPSQGQGLEDVLSARDAGDPNEARRILRDIDRGGGLRTVLRAAAALEAGDDAELDALLPVVAREEPRWRLLLQAAAALDDAGAAARLVAAAEQGGAPGWALAWTRAVSADSDARREGLVALLFSDAALARTVAARDLEIAGAAAEVSATQRYTSFAHGRDCIRRFGAPLVADLLGRAGLDAASPPLAARPRPGAR